MSVEQNIENLRRVSEAHNKGDFSVLPDFIAPNFVMHTAQEVKGPEGVKQMFTMTKDSFPDFHETLEKTVAEGDMVAAFYTQEGTFQNKLGEIAPTGKI